MWSIRSPALHDKHGWTHFEYDANAKTVKQQTPSYARCFDWDGRDMLAGLRYTGAGASCYQYRVCDHWDELERTGAAKPRARLTGEHTCRTT